MSLNIIFIIFTFQVEWNDDYKLLRSKQKQILLQQESDLSDTEISDTLVEYESLLKEYQNKVSLYTSEDHIVESNLRTDETNDYDIDSNEDKDNGYEGDLHASLGSLYMSKNDSVNAIIHLKQAKLLYTLSGEHSEITMANVKLNLATLYLNLGDYLLSTQEYQEALDIYQSKYGDGINPLSKSTKFRGKSKESITDEIIFDSSDIGNVLTEALDKVFKIGNIGSDLSQTLQNVFNKHQSKTTSTSNSNSKKKEKNIKNANVRNIEEANQMYTKQKVNLPSGTVIDLHSYFQQNETETEAM